LGGTGVAAGFRRFFSAVDFAPPPAIPEFPKIAIVKTIANAVLRARTGLRLRGTFISTSPSNRIGLGGRIGLVGLTPVRFHFLAAIDEDNPLLRKAFLVCRHFAIPTRTRPVC